MAEVTNRVTLRYVSQFRCLAGDCKENCCSGLRVELSEPNLVQLVARAAGTPLEPRVAQLVRLEPPETRTARAHAYVDAGGKSCPFLDADWLCDIHRTLGEAALADPCSLFPRVLTELGGRRELSATLACPETARLCLTSPAAVELIPFAEGAMAREIVVRQHDSASADPYVALLDDVRQTCLHVMTADGVGAMTGVLLLADLAERIGPFFHAGTTTFTLDALRTALDELPARLPAVTALIARTPIADLRAIHAIKEMLVARLPSCDNTRFNSLVRPLILRDPDAPKGAVVAYFHGGTEVALTDDELHGRSLAAHARLTTPLEARFDEYARRYIINSIVKDWYTGQPTMRSSLVRLVVRLALSRFTTLTHASLAALAGDDAPLLDDAAVDAFQIIAKNVEHTPSFMALCESYLAEAHLDDLAGLSLLLHA